MNRLVELGNPFTPEHDLNRNDLDFIGDVLGPEAKSLFRSLEIGKARTLAPEETLGGFVLNRHELEEIESSLPHDFWKKIDQMLEKKAEMDEQPRNEFNEWFTDVETWKDFRLDPRQMQTFCDQILTYADHAKTTASLDRGYLFSHILNISIAALPVEDQSRIHLKIMENGRMDSLGWMWANGTLEITHAVGDRLGEMMTGGRIVCPEVGQAAGFLMTGGELVLGKADKACGQEMRGGHMVVTEAGDGLGQRMSGGEIIAQKAGQECGALMASGRIRVDEAGSQLGRKMAGGTIVVGRTGHEVGQQMRDEAKILIMEKVASYSPERSGGHIFRPDGTEVAIGETQ